MTSIYNPAIKAAPLTHCRVRSVTMKAGGAALRILRGGTDPEKIRRDFVEFSADLAVYWGKGLRGFVVAVYDVDGAFNVAYSVDGRVVKVHEAREVFAEAFERAMSRGGG